MIRQPCRRDRIEKFEALTRLEQCDNCIRKGLRDCMYHGYPENTIPKSCAYKIGKAAVETVYDTPVLIRKNDPALKTAQAYMAYCQEKFQRENPCPKCGSHNVDIDLFTPIFCRACGHEWLPEKKE